MESAKKTGTESVFPQQHCQNFGLRKRKHQEATTPGVPDVHPAFPGFTRDLHQYIPHAFSLLERLLKPSGDEMSPSREWFSLPPECFLMHQGKDFHIAMSTLTYPKIVKFQKHLKNGQGWHLSARPELCQRSSAASLQLSCTPARPSMTQVKGQKP